MENHRDGSYLSGNMWKTNEFFPRQTIWKWWVVHIYLNVYRMLGLFRLSHIIQAWRIGWWPMKPSRHRAGYGRIGRRGGVQRKPSKNKKRNLPRWPKTTQWEQKRLNCQQCQKIAPICFQSPRAQSRPQQAHRAVKACYAFTEQIQRSTDAKAAFPDHNRHIVPLRHSLRLQRSYQENFDHKRPKQAVSEEPLNKRKQISRYTDNSCLSFRQRKQKHIPCRPPKRECGKAAPPQHHTSALDDPKHLKSTRKTRRSNTALLIRF